MKRLAFISYEYPPDTGKGGIGTYTAQVASCMAEDESYEVHVFAGSHHRHAEEQEGRVYIHRVLCKDPMDFRHRVAEAFDNVHGKQPFHLVESAEIHGNAWEIKKRHQEIPLLVRMHAPNSLVEMLKKRYIPFTVKLRYVLGALRRGRWDAGYWRKYRKEEDADYLFACEADEITAPSTAMKEWTVKYWGIPETKISVIPNLFIAPQTLLQLPVAPAVPFKRVLFFGRLNVLKGLVKATKAMEKVLRRNQDWTFRVIGDDGAGPYPGITMRQWMQEELKAVLDRVEFIDGLPYAQLHAALADNDIVVLPSLFESFSYTCAEAMAAGKAIVGSRNGGMADLLEGGVCGVLVDPEQEAQIENGVQRLIDHPTVREDMALKARQRITGVYGGKMVGKAYSEFYRRFAR